MRRRTTTTGEKTLVLTFDDGPSESTMDVLGVLSSYGVHATFFVLGENAASNPGVVRALAEAGHGVAIHGWSHTAFTELDPEVLTGTSVGPKRSCERSRVPSAGTFDPRTASTTKS